MDIQYADISKMIDHSLLQQTLTDEQLEAGCQLALEYDVASVCIKPYYLKRCADILSGSTVKASTTIGFPHGGHLTKIKVAEAEAALDDVDWMSCNAERVVETRKSLTESLRQRDFHVWESAANFVLTRVPAGRSAQNLYTGLRQHGILVRYFGKTSSRLAGCLRISIGSDEENEALIQGIDRLLCD